MKPFLGRKLLKFCMINLEKNFLKKPILVTKFGGTSVADTQRLTHVANRLSKLVQDYHLIVVVSAMSGVTNQLVSYCDHMAPSIRDEEVDVVLSSGEQITSGLLSLKLKHMGINAVSLMNWQLNIFTTPSPTQARIKDLDAKILIDMLLQNSVPIIPGFQGINENKRITTLGRGGSDTTAVAVAVALNNELKNSIPIRCDIYTDVDGIYTADPRFVKNAKKLISIPASYMLELAQAGSKVLHPRSVQLALKYKVDVRVLSSFEDDIDQQGTLINHEMDKKMEKSYVYGIAHQQNAHLILLRGAKESIQKIIKNIAVLSLHTDLLSIFQHENDAEFTCTMLDRDVPILKKNIEETSLDVNIITYHDKVTITLVGVGLQNDKNVLTKIYDCIDSLKASIHLLQTSEMKISFVVDQSFTLDLLKKLHKSFLENDNIDLEKS